MFKGEVDICLRPSNINPITKVTVVDCWFQQEILLVVMRYLDIGSRPATLPPKEDIVGVVVQDVEVGLKISDILPC